MIWPPGDNQRMQGSSAPKMKSGQGVGPNWRESNVKLFKLGEAGALHAHETRVSYWQRTAIMSRVYALCFIIRGSHFGLCGRSHGPSEFPAEFFFRTSMVV